MSVETAPVALRNMQSRGLFVVVAISPLVVTPFTVAPFVDPKLLALLIGTTMIAVTRPVVDRRIAIATGLFLSAVAAATVFGRDPLWSLLGTEWRGVGLLALAASAVLLCVATGLQEAILTKIPTWLFWTGVIAATVTTVGRFIGSHGASWQLGPLTSTLGHRVFVGGFLAAALVAALSIPRSRAVNAGLIVLASGLALTAARSGWLGAAFGVLTFAWRMRRWRSVAVVVVPVAAVLAGWTLAARYLPAGADYSAAPRFLHLAVGSGLERLPGWKAYGRAWRNDPIIGSGPQTTWGAYLSNVSRPELRSAGRSFGDPHNLLLEMGTTTGSLGLFTSLVLVFLFGRRALRAPPDRAWALGAVVALAVVQSVEPVNLVLTPLMFLTAGLAVGDEPQRVVVLTRWIAVPMVVALALASTDFVASAFELNARSHQSEASYRVVTQIAPWRLWPPLQLAILRAGDYNKGDRAASIEARRLVASALRRHGWYPELRNFAAEVELEMGDTTASERFVDQQLDIFPLDPVALGRKADLLLRRGDRLNALRYARSALELDPTLAFAQEVERQAGGSQHRAPPVPQSR